MNVLLKGNRSAFSDDGNHGRSHQLDTFFDDEDMDLEDSDFEPGSDRELLGLFFPEVRL